MTPEIYASLVTLILIAVLVIWWMKIARSHALHDAAEKGNLDRMESLVASGYAVDSLYHGLSPLHVAAMNNQVEAAKVLISKGASVNLTAATEGGETPLHLTAMKGHRDMVDLLLDHGADINAQTSGFDPPALIAARFGHAGVLNRLMEKGADPGVTDGEGNNLLFRCVLAEETTLVKMLLDAGVDPNCQDGKQKAYALHAAMVYAAHNGKNEMVQCLLEHGADPHVRDEHGMTPMKMAHIAAKDELAVLLERYGAKG